MAKALATHSVPDASRTTIYNAFTHSRLPMASLVDALVVELLSRIKGLPHDQIDSYALTLSQLWMQADDEDRAKPPGLAASVPKSTTSSFWDDLPGFEQGLTPRSTSGPSLFDDLPLPGFESPAPSVIEGPPVCLRAAPPPPM
ncbi:hypothetical protein [Kitasatospora sp. NPDC089509]|uniref:hypothetical protein n=1 Tax=Kitasatospora sp. NPDC089509 TaxID=3364079 RepID=UPI003822F33C